MWLEQHFTTSSHKRKPAQDTPSRTVCGITTSSPLALQSPEDFPNLDKFWLTSAQDVMTISPHTAREQTVAEE